MDISADVEQIIAQAPDWNFAGDCALLELMKRISQNLQERGEKTSRNLRDFETSVRQVDISLNNATNSLRSLQFGNQFVEYRVEEVDDADLAMPEEKKKPEPPPKTSEEMSKEFLENNLRMFRKNFEPVTIEVPDSDDEDAPVHSTTVFRAKNPYDAIPLPYVIGTKEWEEHKYAGLYDSKENSEDERSEEFSSSSSDERESVPVKITKPANKPEEPHLSDSSSLASFAREPAIVSPVIKPAVQIAEPAVRTQPRPIISSQRNPHERDLFAALRQSPPSDDPPSTSSSPTSSPAFRNPSSRLPIASTASLSSSSSSPAQQPPRLFDEAVSTQTPKETEVKPSQTKRMPVNLFNDDQFKSFMSEIVDKVQTKTGSKTVAPASTIPVKEPPKEKESLKQNAKPEAPKPIAEQSVSKRVNLFDDSPPLSPTPKAEPLFNNNSNSSGAIPKRNDQTKSLFDNSPTTSALPKEKPSKKITKTKSLFDDDLEDDDFLNSFKPKTKPQEQKPLSEPTSSLFDDDDLDIDDIFIKPTAQPNKLSEKVAGKTRLFEDDDQDDVTDLFGSKKTKETSKELPPDISPEKIVEDSPPDISSYKKVDAPIAQKKSLFDDDDLFGTPKAKSLNTSDSTGVEIETEGKQIEIEEESLKIDIKENQPQEIAVNSSVPIHRDSPPPIEIVEEKSEREKWRPVKNVLAEPIPKSTDLFNEDFSDDDSFLSPSNIKVKPNSASETKEFIKPTEENTLEAKENIAPVNPPKPSTKPTDLFNEDFSDDDSFLSASKTKDNSVGATATKEIKIPAEPQLVSEIKPKELPQKLPQNKVDEITTIDEKVDVLPDVLSKPQENVPVSESPPPDNDDSNQDPIITMVADATNKSPKEISTPRKPADLAAAQQIMQNYSNLFSDEPPDDSEFFQTLGSSGLSSLSASKIFDSEHDFFEPALPKIPSATKPSPVTPGDQPSSSSDYGAICLFSDIPPEDDNHAGEESQKPAEAQKEESAATTTRIHTIFYDDFSETARAGAGQPAAKQFSFDDEPPPADEPDRSKDKSPKLPSPTSPVKKLKMPNININVQALLPGSGGLPKVLRKQESSSSEREESSSTAQFKDPIPSSKENVIPSAEGGLQHVNKSRARGPAKRRPSTRKGRKENYAKSLQDSEQAITSSTSIQKGSSDDKAEVKYSEATSAKAPLPQSVKAEKMFSAPALPTLNTTPDLQPLERPPPSKYGGSFLDSPDEDDSFFNSVATHEVPSAKTVGGKQGSDPPKSYRSFLDSPDEDDLLFTPFENKKAAESAFPQAVSKEPPMDRRQLEKTSGPTKLRNSFLDSPDEDDSLFSPVKTVAAPGDRNAAAATVESKEVSAKVAPPPSKLPDTAKAQVKAKPQAAPKLFDDSDDDDDLFASAAVPASVASVPVTNRTKQPTKPAAASLFGSDDEEPEVSAKIAPVKKLPVKTSKSLFSDDDDDDDLFGGGSKTKGSATKKTKPVAKAAPKAPTSKAATATTIIPSKSSDNPLADLLDFE
ncbi:WASH complex subunit 2 [Drosophila subpulchrella]|uniref:WASH complex subunit 2 n=1 Tax=Drosophila subpulchrella TaxID=1486046 RepID=UPI0018A15BE0|nr:WASH complex subunit 2 [Drosophila subpulchrella]XP_037713864.1 WASH complex subunit 2 [Drosophila subpulchrella]